jgi:hypothetical protein
VAAAWFKRSRMKPLEYTGMAEFEREWQGWH